MGWRPRILTLSLAGSLSAAVHAAPPQPDWILTLQARRVVWDDPSLAELNLGVRVRDGVALLWGPVLNEQQSAEAAGRVRLVPGVNGVINELYVLPADDILRKKFAPARPEPQAAPTSLSVAAAPAPPAVRALPSEPIDLLEDVRWSDPRFRALRVSFHNGVVTVIGPADLVAEYSERVRSLPGVRHVRGGTETHPAGAERRP